MVSADSVELVQDSGESSQNELRHSCGIAGVLASQLIDIPRKLFYMLFSLQHRGQESAGIAWEREGDFAFHKNSGMVFQVLRDFLEEDNPAFMGIGHVRYSTQGGASPRNAQPLVVNCSKGTIALAHNGNISNSAVLKSELTAEGAIFQTSSDSELILHLMSRSRKTDIEEVLVEALSKLEGAFSLLVMYGNSIAAIRDSHGFRPLYVGWKDGTFYAASETCALFHEGSIGYREVLPGEIVIATRKAEGGYSLKSIFLPKADRLSSCIFELIYFARPDSGVFGSSVHAVRKRLGAALAEIDPVKPDIVVPVPDSGNIAAIGYYERSGVPFDFGLSRNHYAGRSFIMPTKGQRELAVRMKLHAVPEVVAGKKVVMIDDSLVRGTTSQIIVRLLKEAGAKEVHVRLSSPEIHWPCYYGIDIPTREELISNRKGPEEIAREIKADSVLFLPEEKMLACMDKPSDYCCACFDGNYPCPVRSNTGICP